MGARHGERTRFAGAVSVFAVAVALVVLVAPGARADGFDARSRGVALSELGSPAAAALDTWLRAHDPAGFAEIEQIVLVDVADDGTASCATADVVVDVIGRARPLGRRAKGPRRARVRHEAPPEVARVAIAIAAGDAHRSDAACCGTMVACGGDAVRALACLAESQCAEAVARDLLGGGPLGVVSARVVDRWGYDAMRLSVRISITDQLAVLEDPRRGFRRVFPIGVGAIDAVRRPGQLTSLTPTTDGARIQRATSHEALGAPRWVRNLPFLSLEVPMGWRGKDDRVRSSYVKTRLAFHVHATWRFIRGYTSRGCITMREADLQALADALFFGGGDAISVIAQIDPLPDARHPHAHEQELHFALKNFGTDERPEFRVRGNLYVTEKVLGPPPARALVAVYLDGEARLHRERAFAGAEGGVDDRTP